MRNRSTNGLPSILLIFSGLSLCALPVTGRNYFITTTNDNWGVTSLRWVIMDANRHGGNNTIILGVEPAQGQRNVTQRPRTCVYHLTITGADEDAARTGDLDITRGNLIIASLNTNAVIDATGLGDRVFQIFPHATLTLENLTITGGAPGTGPEIFADGEPGGAILNAGILLMGNCVVTNNSGGGGRNVGGNGVLNISGAGGTGGTNTVYPLMPEDPPTTQVTGSSGAAGAGFDLAGDFVSQGFNLVSTADGSTGLVSGVKADQAGSISTPIDPLIGPLQMNGGPTPTRALLTGSPAIDKGKNFEIHTDQRGHRRPYDYSPIPNASGGDGSDIGAFELDSH